MGDINAVGTTFSEQRLSAPAVNVEGRLEAEFTEDEVLEVLKQAGFRSILPEALKDKRDGQLAAAQSGSLPVRDARFTVVAPGPIASTCRWIIRRNRWSSSTAR